MNKMLRAFIVVILLTLITTTVAMGTSASRAEALDLLAEIEIDVYVGNTGWIGMEGAAHPSMLYRIQDGNEKNDNSLIAISQKLIRKIEELELAFNILDPDDDYGSLQHESVAETGYSFTKRLEILHQKLTELLSRLQGENGVNNPKQLALIIASIETSLTITTEMTQSFNYICIDVSTLDDGAPVEGLGEVAQYLDIQTPTGGAVKIVEGTLLYPAFGSPNLNCPGKPVTVVRNGGLAIGGGFTDMLAVGIFNPLPSDDPIPPSVHEYTFLFEGVTVSNFTLRMLDFGDFNPDQVEDHLAQINAYDDFTIIDTHILEYNSSTEISPTSSDYDSLRCNAGDASADSGYPGNWTWNISGTGITKITLTFPVGHDPYIGFDSLCFVVEP